MKNPSLLPLAVAVVVLLAVSSLPPIAGVAVRIYDAGTSHIECVSGGLYAANSTVVAKEIFLRISLSALGVPRSACLLLLRPAGGAARRQRHRLRGLPLRRLHRRCLPRVGEGVPVPQGGFLLRSQLHSPTWRVPHLRISNIIERQRRKHTDTSHGSGINISSNWVCLAFLLATAGMAQPEKIANMMHSTPLAYLEIKVFAPWALVLGFTFFIGLRLSGK
ncbi:uncharacterized protein LOC120695525 [Panicum virgatum]|uniref:uncharacterized protein LOC120695525 n=1 Tax=Panicum virgatum TaxID=38727 RepID=UPI0019D66C14|nr:uncharacterized protein LOC120695525 [Panicum virgatum]